jgi:hypothetical protein
MIDFKPGRFKIEIDSKPKLVKAWLIQNGQRYSNLNQFHDSESSLELGVSDSAELQEIINSFSAMLIHVKEINFVMGKMNN